MNKRKLWLVPISLLASLFLHSSVEDYYPYKVTPSASNYGNTGIFEIPNARMMPEASLRFNFSSSWPIEYTSLTASPFNWFEATYRYAEIKNAKYGPFAYSGNQSLKDKGFDIKALIKKETYFLVWERCRKRFSQMGFWPWSVAVGAFSIKNMVLVL